MSALYIPGSWLGDIIEGMTVNITGNLFVTYMIIVMLLVIIMIALFKMQMEWVVITITPIVLVLLAYSGEWLALFGLIAIFLGVLIARNWITN